MHGRIKSRACTCFKVHIYAYCIDILMVRHSVFVHLSRSRILTCTFTVYEDDLFIFKGLHICILYR